MQALAAWYLAGAANEWVRPALVEAAVQRARPLFAGLHLPDWVAACDWQANAIPWLRPNAAQAAATLAAVVAKLPAIGGVTWAARCRLSLAYAYLLQEELEAAERTLRLAEESFSDQGQTMDRPRCAYVRIGILRRRGLTRPALALAQETLALCEQMDAVADAARTSLQMGYCHRDLQEEYAAAETSFRRAITLFSAADLPLLVAQAQDGLAQVYQDVGRLAEAAEALAEARLIHDGYPVVVSRAACLVDSGYLELNRGQPAAALDHFQQAGQLYQQFGNQVMVAVVTMYQGEAHQQLGHYQLALSHLEQALERFQELEDPGRRLECQRRLARAWLNLGRPDLAQQLLSQVAAHYQATGQPALQSVILTQQARLFVLEGQLPEAIAYLQKALTAARQAAVQPQVALIQRWLGQVYGQSRRDEEAKEYLTSAAAAFRELAMPVEEAACQVTLGDYWAGRRPAEAETAWRAALELTGALLPEIAWPAWAGLAQLAEEQGDSDQALTAYRSMVGALSSLRQHLHQPSLAGPYLRRPAPALDRAVSLSGRAARPPDALRFIEESKAQGFAHQLTRSGALPFVKGHAPEVAEAIHWLRERLQAEPAATGRRTQSQADLIQQLRQKVLEYDYLAGRLERSQGEWPGEPADAFDLAPFQRAAGAALGEKWAALDYYLSEKTLSLALCTAAGCQIWQREIPASVRLALRLCHQARRQPPHLTPADLTALGEWLLPADLVASLSPTTVVLIAPHRQLHAVPWAALRWPGQTTYLVESCLPLVTPSLHSWRLLWRREEGRPPEPDRPLPPRGLALGVASFGRRHTPLPLVTEEVAAIRAYLDPASTVLLDSAATWDSLRSLAGEEGLARFALWHVASHAYHDPLTGRLSGFALHDRDVWLDEVWQLAPLPGLVVLSACQGIQSLIYEGDEPVSLTATCLAAGARTVMGSLWPVLDVETAALMVEFYKQLSQGQRPAASLALALRQAIAQGLDVRQWAGFLCLGLP